MNRPTIEQLRSLVRAVAAGVVLLTCQTAASADRLHLTNGAVLEVEDTWEDTQGIWYRREGMTHLLERERVRRIERTQAGGTAQADKAEQPPPSAVVKAQAAAPAEQIVRIYLAGGARMEVDEATETADGVWCRRGNLTLLLAPERVERVERETSTAGGIAAARSPRARVWTTGRANLDALIRQSGARHGVDPYLIFCVMEQESHFNPRALSPKGARGLMQLMPATARRLGVRNAHDPAQNVEGGTRYLRELLRQFGGRVELVLAGYNAGEGAVAKYGGRVPPYRETRNYVKRISSRYGRPDTAPLN